MSAEARPKRELEIEHDAPALAGTGTPVRTRFLLLWTAAVIATSAALVAHLALRLETVRLGYEVGQARRVERRLLEEQRMLAIESATLREPDRIEAVARGSLGMDVPSPERIVPVGGSERRRTAGRMR